MSDSVVPTRSWGRWSDPELPPVNVIYLMGYGRSGSTILGNLLGELDGFFHAGELRTLWGHGLLGGRLCGCGAPVRECAVWSKVLELAFGDVEGIAPNPRHMVRVQRDVVRLRNTLLLLRHAHGRPSRSDALDAYVLATARVYRAIAEVTGARVVVDSSKRQADAAVLPLLPGISPHFVHLVRDPRAVAYSWRRSKPYPGEGPNDELHQTQVLNCARNWLSVNAMTGLVRGSVGAGRSLRIRYEDFVMRPRETLARIAEMVGAGPVSMPFLDDRTARLGTNHTAGGNPDRLHNGSVSIREDDEWRTAQRPVDRFVTTAISLPLLLRYGYPLRPGAVGSSSRR